MQWGNCLYGAGVLMIRLRTWKLKALLRRGQWWPHFYVVAHDGGKWHFKVILDKKDRPWHFWWFKGRYERIVKPIPSNERNSKL